MFRSLWSYLVSPYPFSEEQRKSKGLFSWWYNLPGLAVRLLNLFAVLLWGFLIFRAVYGWWFFDVGDSNL